MPTNNTDFASLRWMNDPELAKVHQSIGKAEATLPRLLEADRQSVAALDDASEARKGAQGSHPGQRIDAGGAKVCIPRRRTRTRVPAGGEGSRDLRNRDQCPAHGAGRPRATGQTARIRGGLERSRSEC